MNQLYEILTVGNQYTKKEISVILDDPSISLIREGIRSIKKYNAVFLFVDLEKTGKEIRFHFNDYFDGDFFHWDSQTTQNINSSIIKKIANKGIEIFLFARNNQKTKNITNPFTFCGRLNYQEYEPSTSRPVHIIFQSVDYDENTNSRELLEIYNWSPEKLGLPTSNNEYRVKDSKKSGYIKKPNYTERTGLVTSRVGQGYYRQEILKKWRYKCALTNCNISRILISSHIKGWSECNDHERLDVENGILLSPNVDALFDTHLIAFENDGKIIFSKNVSASDFDKLGINVNLKIKVSAGMIPFLEYHRRIFHNKIIF